MTASSSKLNEHDQIISTLQQLVEPMRATLVGPAEVIVHDLTQLPNSIIAISGDVTGRSIGDPATDKLLDAVASGNLRTSIAYRTTSPSDKELLSTTVIIRDSTNQPVAALCINRDISGWEALHSLTGALAGLSLPMCAEEEQVTTEVFVRDVDELATLLLSRAVAESGVRVDEMRKEHKVEVVRLLKARGFFLLRDAAEMAGKALHCTRFSIYNYLNEIESEKK